MLNQIFRLTGIPAEHRSNFKHLYFDIAWFGVLSGSAVNFLSVYITRIGGTGVQIGLLSAMPAVVSLILAIPAGRWLEKRDTNKAIFWTSVVYRIGFIPFAFLPALLSESAQILAFILLTFFMSIPLTPLGVGFNALFAETVPDEYRAHVAGIRNVMFALTYMLSSVASGYLLDTAGFPFGYQIVFVAGAFGAAMSSYHLYFVKPLTEGRPSHHPRLQPASPPQPQAAPRAFLSAFRLDIWRTSFRNVLIGLFAFHASQYLPTALFPLYNIRVLNLNDNHIGIGTALFYLTVLAGSTQLRRLAHRLGNKTLTGWSAALMALYPLLLSFSTNVWQYYGVSLIGGMNFALVSGTYANYMLDRIPPDDRPPHLAWYNIILNASILIGSLGGPILGDVLGLSPALLLIAALRFLAGLLILKRG
jgi:MFS family permease